MILSALFAIEMESKRVIVIEDDPEICELLNIHLQDLDCEIEGKNSATLSLALYGNSTSTKELEAYAI